MLKAHKIRLNPTLEQEQYFWKASNVARFVFNWGLGEYNKRKELNETAPIIGRGKCLKSEFASLKATCYPWVEEVSSYAYQGAFLDLQKSIQRYYEQKKKGNLKPSKNYKKRKDGKPFGWPRFKSKNKTIPSFYQANTCLRFNGNYIRLEKLGWVNMAEPLRFEGKVMGARVSHHANYWWISIQVEVEQKPSQINNNVVGVDLGIKYLAVTSDGQIYDNPKPFVSTQKKLARLQRSFCRMTKDGKNWQKMKEKINKLHFRISNLRSEASHQMTTELTNNYGIIGIEDLNVKGMLKNSNLSKTISDAAFYEKRRQLEYKSKWKGGKVISINRWFPSSKMCSNCSNLKHDLTLNDREWICSNCNQLNYRDENAAKNIKQETIRILTNE